MPGGSVSLPRDIFLFLSFLSFSFRIAIPFASRRSMWDA